MRRSGGGAWSEGVPGFAYPTGKVLASVKELLEVTPEAVQEQGDGSW